MSAIPFIKMGTLLLKQASKPFASQFKKNAHRSETLQGMCIAVGRFWNQGTTRINMMTLGHKVKKVKPLSDEDAVAKGADLLGEGIVYTVAVAAVFIEYRRKDFEAEEKKTEKEAKEREANAILEARFAAIEKNMETMAAELRKANEKAEAARRSEEARRRSWWRGWG